MADKVLDQEPWTGCAVLFLQSLCPDANLLSLYKNQQEKFIFFKVIKLTLIGEQWRFNFNLQYINVHYLEKWAHPLDIC